MCPFYRVSYETNDTQLNKHGADFYIILGHWGERASAAERFAVAVHYRADAGATGFMIVDADQTTMSSHPLVGRALSRNEVAGTPLAQEVFDLLDFIWHYDGRISEITTHKPGR